MSEGGLKYFMQLIIPAIIISYLIGSLPTAYIFGRFLKGIDIRKFGSGNVGATNALRVLGKRPALVVLAIDILKGVLPVVFLGDYLLARGTGLAPEALRIIIGISCIVGHNWTVFLNFKGGKGIATSFGVLLGLAVRIAGLNAILGLVILTWLAVFISTRIVSLSSVAAGVGLPIYMAIFKQPLVLLISSIILSVFVVIRHQANLKRFFQGKEPRLSFRKNS